MNWDLSLTQCQLSRKRCWCSVHQTWGWCHPQAQSKSFHPRPSLVNNKPYPWAISQAMRRLNNIRRRTQRPCRCKPLFFQVSSKSLLTTSRDSPHHLRLLKKPKSLTLPPSLRTSSRWLNQNRKRRKATGATRVQEARKRTKRRFTTTELPVQRQMLVEGKEDGQVYGQHI